MKIISDYFIQLKYVVSSYQARHRGPKGFRVGGETDLPQIITVEPGRVRAPKHMSEVLWKHRGTSNGFCWGCGWGWEPSGARIAARRYPVCAGYWRLSHLLCPGLGQGVPRRQGHLTDKKSDLKRQTVFGQVAWFGHLNLCVGHRRLSPGTPSRSLGGDQKVAAGFSPFHSPGIVSAHPGLFTHGPAWQEHQPDLLIEYLLLFIFAILQYDLKLQMFSV